MSDTLRVALDVVRASVDDPVNVASTFPSKLEQHKRDALHAVLAPEWSCDAPADASPAMVQAQQTFKDAAIVLAAALRADAAGGTVNIAGLSPRPQVARRFCAFVDAAVSLANGGRVAEKDGVAVLLDQIERAADSMEAHDEALREACENLNETVSAGLATVQRALLVTVMTAGAVLRGTEEVHDSEEVPPYLAAAAMLANGPLVDADMEEFERLSDEIVNRLYDAAEN
ncbi:hypothetical protein AURDEDRAFT_183011 [Auricularia subglabra TFB-10046 SS5]|nr:hypothetical protein AURDEDRAFT_183011 [Auricularia subglabra TFB-10046 SS5]